MHTLGQGGREGKEVLRYTFTTLTPNRTKPGYFQ